MAVQKISLLQDFQSRLFVFVHLLSLIPSQARKWYNSNSSFCYTHLISTEDDITMKLSEIIFFNDVIQRHRATGAKVQMILVQYRLATIDCYVILNRKAGTIFSYNVLFILTAKYQEFLYQWQYVSRYMDGWMDGQMDGWMNVVLRLH